MLRTADAESPRTTGSFLRRVPRWVLVLAGALVVGGALIAWRLSAGQKSGGAARYATVEVSRGPLQARVTANGTLSALVTVQVGSQVSGRIHELFVDFNSKVKKGQLLARLDPKLFQAAVEQARANHAAARGNLVKAQVQLEDAQRQLDRMRALFERKLVAQAELDTAESGLRIARAQIEAARGSVEQSKASLLQAETNLAYTEISSPIDGQVISRSVDVGQTVAASLQAPTLFVIAEDLRKMQVNTSIPEADVGKLQEGMPARFSVDAFPSEVFDGTIRQVRNAPTTIQNVVTYDAVIDVENPDLKLRPGMTANVTITYAEREDVLRIPNAALRFRPPQSLQPRGERGAARPGTPDERTVWILEGQEPKPVKIRVGVNDGSFSEVVGGKLIEGQRVVSELLGGPRNGSPAPAAPRFGRPF